MITCQYAERNVGDLACLVLRNVCVGRTGTLLLLAAFAQSPKVPITFVMSLCQSAYVTAAPTGRIFVTFGIGKGSG